VIRSPKLHVADTGMLCSLIGVGPSRLAEDAELAGSVFETFVVDELIRLASVSELVPCSASTTTATSGVTRSTW
jgi:predicted AAA+ superfamily ATPase